MTVNVEELAEFPMPRERWFEPPKAMMQLMAEQPVSRVRLWNGQTPWLLTRYDDVKAVLASRTVSSDLSRPGAPIVDPALIQFNEGILSHLDPPEHDELRRMLAPEFMVKRINRLRPSVEAIVQDRVDAMIAAGPPVNLVDTLALPVPMMVTCDLLGVPYEDRDYFASMATSFLGGRNSAEETARLVGEYRGYIGRLVDGKMTAPTDDVIGYMASVHVANGRCSRDALIVLAGLLVIAGFDTTASLIALGVLALLDNPGQMALLCQDPSLVPGAVEELLRFLSITHRGLHRVATEDIEIGGQIIRAGEGIIAAINTANRDEAAFADPDVLDVGRNARNHLAFGHGIHQCLGAALARLELQVVFTCIVEQFPNLQLVGDITAADLKDEAIVYGARRVMVRW